jgi:hypothetical protein
MKHIIDKDSDSEPKKKKQATLGTFFRTQSGAQLLPPVPVRTAPCPHCQRDCINRAGLIVHLKFCPAISDASSPTFLSAFRSLFPLEPVPEKEVEVEVVVVEEAPLAAAGNDAMDIDEPTVSVPNPISSKPKKLRKRYSNRFIVKNVIEVEPKVRKQLADFRDVPMDALSQNDINRIISHNTGAPFSNIGKWLRKKDKHLGRYAKKTNRKKKNFGSGRSPSFPASEAKAAEYARNRRLKQLLVSTSSLIKIIKEGALKENADLARTHKFNYEYLLSFLIRAALALRFPSNTKPMSLENGITVCRGYLQWFHKLISDEFGDGIARHRVMHSTEGRFPFDCRFNKDEVIPLD